MEAASFALAEQRFGSPAAARAESASGTKQAIWSTPCRHGRRRPRVACLFLRLSAVPGCPSGARLHALRIFIGQRMPAAAALGHWHSHSPVSGLPVDHLKQR